MAPFIHPHNYDSDKHHHNNPSNKPTTTTNWFLCCFGCSSVDRSKNRVLNQSHPEEDRGCSCISNDHESSTNSSRSGEKENTGSQKKRKKKKKFKYLKFVYWPVCRIHRAMKNPSKKNKLLVDDNDQQLLHTQTKDVKGNNSSYEIVEVPDIDFLQASRLIHTSIGVSVTGAANESPSHIQRMKNNRADRQPMINVDRVSKLKTQHTVATKNRSDKRKCNKDGSGSQNHKRRSTSNKFPYTDGGIIDHKHPVIGMFILAVTLVIMVLCGPLCAILCTSACFYCIPWLVKLDNGITMVYGGGRDGDTNNNKQRDDNSSGVNISSELYRKKVVFEGFSRRDRT